MSTYSYIGKGKTYIGKRGGFAKKFVGNISSLSLAVTEKKIDLLDFTQAGGGKDDTVSRIEEVAASMNLHQLSPENLALALFGNTTAVTAAPVTDEVHAGYKGGLIRLDNLPDPATPVVVTNSAGTTTYDVDVDYVQTKSGIEITSASTIVEAADLKISYTKLPADVVQLLSNAADEYSLTFEGLNEAKSGRAVVVDLHKVKFSPAQKLDLIGDDFAGLEITGEVLLDDTITGTGLSKYAKIELAKAA